MGHALERTNPKGQDFLGKCIKCNTENLKSSAIFEDCPSDDQMSDEEAIINLIMEE